MLCWKPDAVGEQVTERRITHWRWISLPLLGIAGTVFISLRLVPTWNVDVREIYAKTPTVDARSVHLARGKIGVDATVVRLARSKTVTQLIDLEERQTLVDVAHAATLTINGGYFDSSFVPLGLYRIEGRQASPLLERPPLSGVVLIDSAGRLDLVSRDAKGVIATAHSAFQAGPFLIDPGGSPGIRSDDGKTAERTVIAIGDSDSLVIVLTSPTTLYALAEMLHSKPEIFGLHRVDRAINLDGGPSTGFVLNMNGQHLQSLPRSRIRNALSFRSE
jgi:uncharacterized protein YigE (DUF2233 family)